VTASTTTTAITATQGWSQGGAGRGPGPCKEFFSSPSLNNIYNFSLSSKAIKILAPLNFIFYFRHCRHHYSHFNTPPPLTTPHLMISSIIHPPPLLI